MSEKRIYFIVTTSHIVAIRRKFMMNKTRKLTDTVEIIKKCLRNESFFTITTIG